MLEIYAQWPSQLNLSRSNSGMREARFLVLLLQQARMKRPLKICVFSLCNNLFVVRILSLSV